MMKSPRHFYFLLYIKLESSAHTLMPARPKRRRAATRVTSGYFAAAESKSVLIKASTDNGSRKVQVTAISLMADDSIITEGQLFFVSLFLDGRSSATASRVRPHPRDDVKGSSYGIPMRHPSAKQIRRFGEVTPVRI